MDVAVVEFDGGSIMVPGKACLSLFQKPLQPQIQHAFAMILQPEVACADYAFPPLLLRAPHPAMLGKELQAVFVRSFVQLLQGC